MTVADMFQNEGYTYMAYADKLIVWLDLFHILNWAMSQRIKAQMRRYFRQWGSSEQLSTDGGTDLANEEMAGFLGE